MPSFRGAVRTLSDHQKSARGVSYYSRWINRPAGRLIAAAAYSGRLTPNHVSLLSGALTLAGIVLIGVAPPSIGIGIAAWLLLAIGFAVDSADGQLARLRGGGTLAGEWLDHVLDAGKMVLVHAAVLVGWYRFLDLPAWMLLIPLGFQLAGVVTFMAGTLAELLKRTAAPSASRAPSNLRSMLLIPADYGVFCLLFLLYGFPPLFVALYSSFAAIYAAYLVIFLFKWFRELSRA